MSPTNRFLLFAIGIEVSLTPMVSIVFLSALEISQGRTIAIAVLAATHLVRAVIEIAFMVRFMRPLERWRALFEIKEDTADIGLEGARVAYRMPYVYTLVHTGLWTAALPLAMSILLVVFPHQVVLDPYARSAVIIWTGAIVAGSGGFIFPVAEWLLADHVKALSLRLQALAVRYHGTGMSLTTRLMVFVMLWAAAPTLWLGATGYLNAAHGNSQLIASDNHGAVLELAAAARTPDPATGTLPDVGALVDGRPGAFVLAGDGTLRGTIAQAILAEHPLMMKRLQLEAARTASGRTFDVQAQIAVSYARVGPSTVIGKIVSTDVGPGGSFWTAELIFFVLVASASTLAAWLLSRSTVGPIQKLTATVEDIRLGRVANVAPIAIHHHDETGKLATDVNGMLDVLRTLSQQARSIGTGDLSATFSIGGDLGESFRAQLDSLRSIVSHLAQNAAQLGAAASELYAASQEQETVARHQSAGVHEVGKTMESLLAAAAHISEATQGVLARAERTHETTDRTAEKIGELSAHAGKIGEILEDISEIADRSDLLALNAALEGTRAGDAGRGFTLVAAEMRKLAERVMGSVGDIKQLVADVRGSIATTIMVTEESAKLADGTTESARQISLVTQQQSSGTEQAAHSMRDVTAMLTQSLSATEQIRALAGNLKGQAEQLTALVARFKIDSGTSASA